MAEHCSLRCKLTDALAVAVAVSWGDKYPPSRGFSSSSCIYSHTSLHPLSLHLHYIYYYIYTLILYNYNYNMPSKTPMTPGQRARAIAISNERRQRHNAALLQQLQENPSAVSNLDTEEQARAHQLAARTGHIDIGQDEAYHAEDDTDGESEFTDDDKLNDYILDELYDSPSDEPWYSEAEAETEPAPSDGGASAGENGNPNHPILI